MIRLVEDFSKFPGGRYLSDGPYSGEKFRKDLLIPALEKDNFVSINLDGTMGLPASFLEEAFGGLVRGGYDKDYLLSKIEIKTTEPRLRRYTQQIQKIIETAE